VVRWGVGVSVCGSVVRKIVKIFRTFKFKISKQVSRGRGFSWSSLVAFGAVVALRDADGCGEREMAMVTIFR